MTLRSRGRLFLLSEKDPLAVIGSVDKTLYLTANSVDNDDNGYRAERTN